MKNPNKHLFELTSDEEHIEGIKLWWHREDVTATFEDQNMEEDYEPLTDDQIDAVLIALVYNHDALVGVNWEVIAFYIERIATKR